MALTTYFGQNATPAWYVNGAPATARASLMALLSGVHTETFESFARGAAAPLSLFGGTATLTDASASGGIETIRTIAGDTPGRFNTTGATSAPVNGGWWQSAFSFVVTFATPVNAFCTYVTDATDFGGGLSLTLNGSSGSVTVPVPIADSAVNGGLALIGFTDDARTFSSITFNITQASGTLPGDEDVIGFDDMTTGVFAPAAAVSGSYVLDDLVASGTLSLTPAVNGNLVLDDVVASGTFILTPAVSGTVVLDAPLASGAIGAGAPAVDFWPGLCFPWPAGIPQ